MTLQNPLHALPRSFKRAVFLHRLNEILAARRSEAAVGAEPGADAVLVDPHQAD